MREEVGSTTSSSSTADPGLGDTDYQPPARYRPPAIASGPPLPRPEEPVDPAESMEVDEYSRLEARRAAEGRQRETTPDPLAIDPGPLAETAGPAYTTQDVERVRGLLEYAVGERSRAPGPSLGRGRTGPPDPGTQDSSPKEEKEEEEQDSSEGESERPGPPPSPRA